MSDLQEVNAEENKKHKEHKHKEHKHKEHKHKEIKEEKKEEIKEETKENKEEVKENKEEVKENKEEVKENKEEVKENKEEVKPVEIPKLHVEKHHVIVPNEVGLSPRGSSHVPVVWYKEKQEGDVEHDSGEEEDGKKKKKEQPKLHIPHFNPVQSVKTLLSPRSQKKADDEFVVSFPVGRPEVVTVIEDTSATATTTTTTTTSTTTPTEAIKPLPPKQKVEPAQPQVWYQEKPSEFNDIPKWRGEIQIHVSSSSEEGEDIIKKKGKKEPVLGKIVRSVSNNSVPKDKEKDSNPIKTLLSPRSKKDTPKEQITVKREQPKTITLYHIPRWRSTRPVWLYHELVAAYGETTTMPQLLIHEFDPLAFRKEKPEWFLKINPNGKIPVMTYGDISMFDGIAICNFLLSQFDKEKKFFLANNPEFLALFYQISFYCSGTVDNLTASSSPIQRVLQPDQQFADEEVNHKAWAELVGPYLSQLLGKNKYLFGDEFTALDLIFGYNCCTLNEKKDWLKEFPNLLEYYNERIKVRPSFISALTFDHLSFKHES